MFCPLCKAEYRQGFTHCADCGVELVFSQAEGSNEKTSTEQIVEEFLVPLWRGEDSAVYERIKEALNGERIPFYEIQPEEFQAALVSPYPSIPHPNFGFEIRVMPSQLDSASRILNRILDQEPENQEIALAESLSEDFPEDSTKVIPVDWNTAEATTKVWIGPDASMAEFIADTLRENGILSQKAVEENGENTLLVVPEDESRAREILREITEGTPLP